MPPSRTEKKKKPPSFQHFPAARAKVLKKAWVEKTKIKSKWKAEKRKMGLAGPPKPPKDDHDDVGSEGAQEDIEGRELEAGAQIADSPPRGNNHRAEATNRAPAQLKGSEKSEGGKEPRPVGLRELARKAYSRESLHTYKSDPFNRRKKGDATSKEGGKGQPNMKLRMNFMLEKIKRDYS